MQDVYGIRYRYENWNEGEVESDSNGTGGSGALLYNNPHSQIEVYNDINDDLTQFFSVLRDREDDLVEFLEAVPNSQSLYDDWVEDFSTGFDRTTHYNPIAAEGKGRRRMYYPISLADLTSANSKRAPPSVLSVTVTVHP